MSDLILLAISCIFVNNILLMQYLGNCPFLGVSKRMETATGMAMAVVFVLVMAGAITWITNAFILKPFGYGIPPDVGLYPGYRIPCAIRRNVFKKGRTRSLCRPRDFSSPDNHQLRRYGRMFDKCERGIQLHRSAYILTELRHRIRVGIDPFCGHQRTDHTRESAQAATGHLDRTRFGGDAFPCILRF